MLPYTSRNTAKLARRRAHRELRRPAGGSAPSASARRGAVLVEAAKMASSARGSMPRSPGAAALNRMRPVGVRDAAREGHRVALLEQRAHLRLHRRLGDLLLLGGLVKDGVKGRECSLSSDAASPSSWPCASRTAVAASTLPVAPSAGGRTTKTRRLRLALGRGGSNECHPSRSSACDAGRPRRRRKTGISGRSW